MFGTAIAVWVGLTVANFASQALWGQSDWGMATERSFFQAVALGTFLFVSYAK